MTRLLLYYKIEMLIWSTAVSLVTFGDFLVACICVRVHVTWFLFLWLAVINVTVVFSPWQRQLPWLVGCGCECDWLIVMLVCLYVHVYRSYWIRSTVLSWNATYSIRLYVTTHSLTRKHISHLGASLWPLQVTTAHLPTGTLTAHLAAMTNNHILYTVVNKLRLSLATSRVTLTALTTANKPRANLMKHWPIRVREVILSHNSGDCQYQMSNIDK